MRLYFASLLPMQYHGRCFKRRYCMGDWIAALGMRLYHGGLPVPVEATT